MNTSQDQARHIFNQWHQTVMNHDAEGLAALYAENARFESPAVYVLTGEETGVLIGRDAVRDYFRQFFAKLAGAAEWYRSGRFFFDGQALAWEYPRATPRGDQTDLVEWMDLENGLIKEHRVFWGWIGVKTLLAARDKTATG